MTKIRRLQLGALDSCKFRGHAMSNFFRLSDNQRIAGCMICDRSVIVNRKPAPNEIEIAGEAVALNCENKA